MIVRPIRRAAYPETGVGEMPKEVFLSAAPNERPGRDEYEEILAYDGFKVGWTPGKTFVFVGWINRSQNPDTGEWSDSESGPLLTLDSRDAARLIKILKRAQSQVAHSERARPSGTQLLTGPPGGDDASQDSFSVRARGH